MLNNRFRLLYRRTRRRIDKILAGYASEFYVNTVYPFRNKHVPENKFIIFTYQRTGSTLLVDLLNSHPLIKCEGEILLNRMHNPIAFINHRSQLFSTEIYGFKLQISHLDYQRINDPVKFVTDIFNEGYKIIKLTRSDLFRTALSLQYAIDIQRFHFKNNSPNHHLPVISINPAELIKSLDWIVCQIKTLEQITKNLPHLALNYEDALYDNKLHQQTIDSICEYLQIPTAKVESDLVKATSDNMFEYISNNNEIIEYLNKTEFKYLNSSM